MTLPVVLSAVLSLPLPLPLLVAVDVLVFACMVFLLRRLQKERQRDVPKYVAFALMIGGTLFLTAVTVVGLWPVFFH